LLEKDCLPKTVLILVKTFDLHCNARIEAAQLRLIDVPNMMKNKPVLISLFYCLCVGTYLKNQKPSQFKNFFEGKKETIKKATRQ